MHYRANKSRLMIDTLTVGNVNSHVGDIVTLIRCMRPDGIWKCHLAYLGSGIIS